MPFYDRFFKRPAEVGEGFSPSDPYPLYTTLGRAPGRDAIEAILAEMLNDFVMNPGTRMFLSVFVSIFAVIKDGNVDLQEIAKKLATQSPPSTWDEMQTTLATLALTRTMGRFSFGFQAMSPTGFVLRGAAQVAGLVTSVFAAQKLAEAIEPDMPTATFSIGSFVIPGMTCLTVGSSYLISLVKTTFASRASQLIDGTYNLIARKLVLKRNPGMLSGRDVAVNSDVKERLIGGDEEQGNAANQKRAHFSSLNVQDASFDDREVDQQEPRDLAALPSPSRPSSGLGRRSGQE